MNALTNQTSQNALAAYGAVDPFAAAAESMGATANLTYMKFNGDNGQWTKGQNSDIVEIGTRMAIDPLKIMRGYICWVRKEMKHEELIPVVELPGGRLPSVEQLGLPDFGPYDPPPAGQNQGDGYREQACVRGMLTDGEAISYKTATRSAIIAVGNLLKSYGAQYKTHPAGSWPVVSLETSSFKPKGSSYTKYAPVLRIVDWLSPEQVASLAPGEDAADYEDDGQGAAPTVDPSEIPYVQDEPAAEEQQVQQAAPSRPAPPPRSGNAPQRPPEPRKRAF